MTATTAPTAPSATTLTAPARPWWMMLINGILAFIVGAVLLWAPVKVKIDAYLLLIWFLGFYWLFRGIFDIVYMFIDHTAWGWKLFMGIVGIMAGSYILMYPVASGLVLPKIFVWVLGFWGLMEGIILLIMAFKGGGWGAGILGALSIIFGCILLANATVPGMGLSFVWAAAWMGVIGGIVMIVQAFRSRKA
jgi:uncharacterized membrane protein HdeD (DUF308 family)